MEIRSGDLLGHSMTNVLLLEPLLCYLGTMIWVIVVLEDLSTTIFNVLTEGRRLSPKISRYMAPSHLSMR